MYSLSKRGHERSETDAKPRGKIKASSEDELIIVVWERRAPSRVQASRDEALVRGFKGRCHLKLMRF